MQLLDKTFSLLQFWTTHQLCAIVFCPKTLGVNVEYKSIFYIHIAI